MKPAATILIVDDDPAIADLLKFTLDKAGQSSVIARNGAEAWHSIRSDHHSLILLDWTLSDLSGYHLLTRIRANRETDKLPVIVLTAKDREEHLIAGLDNGADDCITKPFSPGELTARINALLRRKAPEHAHSMLTAGDVSLDPISCTVTVASEKIAISCTDFELLKFLLSHPNRVFSRRQLLESVWDGQVMIKERTVDVHVMRLRKVLKGGESMIKTVRRVGYMLSEK